MVKIPESWQAVTESIRLTERLIDAMSRNWRVALTLTLLVIIGGTTSTLVQIIRDESHKVLVGICGAMTAAITTVNGLVFPWRLHGG